jgi:SAM-dependent methyltransferase
VTIPVTVFPLHLETPAFLDLLRKLGPSLGLWRAAEVAALRSHHYTHPVLDLGCGDGLVASMVLKKVEVGCDPYAESLRHALSTGVYDRLEPVAVEETRVPPASMAVVISNSVLEHIPNLDPVIESVSRILAPGGHFVFTTPSDRFAQWLMLPAGRYRYWRNRRLGHVNLWSKEQWAARLELYRLKVRDVRPYLKPPLVFFWDTLDLLEQVWIARKRVLGVVWRHLPTPVLSLIARAASRLDLSAYEGGGQMIVAEKLP